MVRTEVLWIMSDNRKLRCAVSTRKSSEEGLDQAFNSLDAQREACVAYISSQASLGWRLVPDAYDDGGISGGTLERPAIQRLLQHIKGGRIDVVVVYKIDRLTRSLMDFAKLVEVFDGHSVSFVSVTQQFNTTTSMGRLTLNVLLSFAQFEREVTAERIRDRVAASKKKGMWMGGIVPFGYRAHDRKLLIDEANAAQVLRIFNRYLELRSVQVLELNAAGASAIAPAPRSMRPRPKQQKSPPLTAAARSTICFPIRSISAGSGIRVNCTMASTNPSSTAILSTVFSGFWPSRPSSQKARRCMQTTIS
jgi:DNA invertase Pin-like site-specific DNA recombinase